MVMLSNQQPQKKKNFIQFFQLNDFQKENQLKKKLNRFKGWVFEPYYI